MSEAQLLAAVIELAEMLGWRVFHQRPARTAQGWRSTVQGTFAKGFPDLVLARREEVLFVELKAEKGRTSFDQREWLRELPGDSVFLWYPKDWLDGTIEQVLRHGYYGAAA
jgi:hypothetical protein